MIPLYLELENFMSYRRCTQLDLRGLHVVCLVGENGAGKSTLLDAVTWALWGRARARRDDELISQGADAMRVVFEFSEGQHVYRVLRTRRRLIGRGKTFSSSGTLDFFVRNNDGEWVQLSGDSMAETQEKINRTLNLTYDTFINSAYLKQGRADEFTVKKPAERKALLGEILDLGIWQTFEANAKRALIEAETKQAHLRLELERAQQEADRLPEYEALLEQARSDHQKAHDALQAAQSEWNALEGWRVRERELLSQRGRAEEHLRQIAEELQAVRDQHAAHAKLLQTAESVLAQREAIEQGYAELQRVQGELDALNEKLLQINDLTSRKHALENHLANARRLLEKERDDHRRQLDELLRYADDAAARERLGKLKAQLDALQADEQSLDATQQALSAAQQKVAELQAHNQALRREMEELKTRLDALNGVGSACPTCGRTLSEEERQRLRENWSAEGRARAEQYRANERTIKALYEQRAQLEQQLKELRQRLQQQRPALQREVAALEARIAQAEEARAKLPAIEAALRDVEQRLTHEAYEQETRAKLGEVDAELAALAFDRTTYEQLKAQLQALKPFEQRKAELERAALVIEAERNALQLLEANMRQIEARHSSAQAEVEKINAELDECRRHLQAEAQRRQALERAKQAFFNAQSALVGAEQRVHACIAQRQRAQALRQEIEALSTRCALLESLQTAFGKNGVPAMIVESALPELENMANELLGRMTDGRLHVRFETQRQTQRGDTAETLEIRIADELGERAYEMFSGGEAFRVNFAIRIALSRLLANRANARLQTLFIDEGFGTQDAQGRERLVEAIRAIQDEFECIVVITHIEELKEAFPRRIEVRRTEAGSAVQII